MVDAQGQLEKMLEAHRATISLQRAAADATVQGETKRRLLAELQRTPPAWRRELQPHAISGNEREFERRRTLLQEADGRDRRQAELRATAWAQRGTEVWLGVERWMSRNGVFGTGFHRDEPEFPLIERFVASRLDKVDVAPNLWPDALFAAVSAAAVLEATNGLVTPQKLAKEINRRDIQGGWVDEDYATLFSHPFMQDCSISLHELRAARQVAAEELEQERFEQQLLSEALPEEAVDGLEFEFRVKEVLESLGWAVQMTPASNDQGADLLAQRDQRSVAIQVKHYGKPVGNRAVQEAHAGRTYYGMGEACVVSSAAFTPSAVEAARRMGVHLRHVSDLPNL